jgi:DNA-binding transcriptional ArsR family regulator
LAPPQNLQYLCTTGHPPREVLAYVLRACEEHGIGVVAIDSVGLALEGDPGKSRDVIDFFKELDLFKVKGITLILVDHQAKLQSGESYQSKLQYGNAYKGNLSRSRVQVELKKKGGSVRSLVLRQNKGNFSDLAEPFGVKLGFEAGKISVEREELGAEDLSEERVLNTSDRVLLALYDGPRYPEGFYSQSVWGVKMPTVENSISKLRKDGLVRDTGNREGQSREIEFTDAGRNYVQEYLKRARPKLHHGHEPLRECEDDGAWIKREE